MARAERVIGSRRTQITDDTIRRVFSRGQLLDRLQGDDYEGYERTIDSHVKNLRKKLAPEAGTAHYINTVHGIGYRLEVPRDSAAANDSEVARDAL